MGKSSINGQFSMAMLNIQRVTDGSPQSAFDTAVRSPHLLA